MFPDSGSDVKPKVLSPDSSIGGVSTDVVPADLELCVRALDFTTCGVTIADTTVPDMPLIYVNRAFCDMTGFAENEVVGRNCRFLQGDDRDQPGLEQIRAALRDQSSCRVVLRNYRKDGTQFWNELAISPIFGAGGELTHFVGIQSDVSERERARRERVLMFADLEAVNRELVDFAHIVSHDLRAPLRSIDKICEILAEDHSAELEDEALRLIEFLVQRSRRLRRLVSGVLDYSRAGRSPVQPHDVDLSRVVSEVVDSLEVPELIQVVVPPDLPKLRSDHTRLAQIFQNLIGNAVEHMGKPEGRIVVRCEDLGDSWRFAVEDDGPGIAKEHQKMVFGMFETLRSRDQVETVGVGLTIVKKLVGQLDGRVWLESARGRGTKFFFELPRIVDD